MAKMLENGAVVDDEDFVVSAPWELIQNPHRDGTLNMVNRMGPVAVWESVKAAFRQRAKECEEMDIDNPFRHHPDYEAAMRDD